MVAYGTYERVAYNTAPLPSWVSWNGGATLLRVLSWVTLLTAVAFGLLALFFAINLVVTLATPVVVACCVVVAPVVGKLVLGGVIITVFGWVTYPKGGK